MALQAVMAALLGGDTIHHALGIPVFGRKQSGGGAENTTEIAKRVLQWRWLIIDEISMVSAKLLATMDMKLRSVIRALGTKKIKRLGMDRLFGGLNVLMCGDLWQLPCPDGGYLGDIPTEFIRNARKYDPSPSIAHGQSILWGGPNFGVQGVTELVQCERCDDAWLREVQEEIRQGNLSELNHSFLHGSLTNKPGSWCKGDVECGKETCRNLACETAPHDAANVCGSRKRTRENLIEKVGEKIKRAECTECKAARNSKCLVAADKDDSRFKAERFQNAIAIFANNDVKYDSNKLRAKEYGVRSGQQITYVAAKDTPSNHTLEERPDVVLQKREWLKRHDRECGDLYGMLPLIKGMPVMLTDHVDRNPEKMLLRGRI